MRAISWDEQDAGLHRRSRARLLEASSGSPETLNQKLFLYGLTGEGDVKRMVGVDALRLRDGEYRVVFEESATALTIVAVGHRRAIYR